MSRLKRMEIELNKEEYFTMDDNAELKANFIEMRIASIMEALSLQDPKNKKAENFYPGEVPGQEGGSSVEYFTVFEPTITGDERKKLIQKLVDYLLADVEI